MTAPQLFAAPDPSRILADAARLGEDVPALRPVLDAFVPLFIAQAEARERAAGLHAPWPENAVDRLYEGVPVLAACGFGELAPYFAAAARAVLPAMEKGFPAIAARLSALGQDIAQGKFAAADAVQAAFADEADGSAGVGGADAAAISFVSRMVLRPLLARQAAEVAARIKDVPWQRPFCPVCGDKPDFSRLLRVRDEAEYLSGHGGVRFLHCATCGTQWRYKRISCTECGNEEPSRITVLHASTRPFERLDVCEACKTYCPCLDASEFVEVPDPDLAALALLPLELDAKSKGYRPIAGMPWMD